MMATRVSRLINQGDADEGPAGGTAKIETAGQPSRIKR